MTSTWFFPALFIFGLFGLYTWLIGRAVFGVSAGIAEVFRLPWLGYAVLLLLLQIGHLFWPINRPFSFWFLGVTSLIAVAIALRKAARAGRSLIELGRRWPKHWPLIVVGLCCFYPVLNTCTKPACHYDLGLYYLQGIRWLETFPIVPGLGNLLLNLGYNQSAFLVTAFLDSLLPNRIGLWLVGGLLPWLGLTLSAYALIRLLSARSAQRSPLETAYAISLPAWIYTLLGNNISSGSPDVTSSSLVVHLFLAFAAFLMTADRAERARTFGDLWVLGAVCLCLKLNALGLVVGILTVATFFLILEKDFAQVWRSKAIFGAAIGASLIGFWVYRGIILSGYPLFPSRLMAAPVPWQIPPSAADRFREDVVYWSRIPFGDREMALDGLSWVGPWMSRVASLDIQFAWPIGIGLVGSVAVLLFSWMEVRLRRSRYFWMLLSAPLLLHTIFWILTAPEPRYFGSTPWLFAAAPVLGLIAAEHSVAFLSAIAKLYLCAVPMAGLKVSTAWAWAAPDAQFPEIPRPAMAEHVTRAGLLHYAPTEGNQSFDHPLPSSNSKLGDIELLDPAAGIAGGFRSARGGNNPKTP